MRTKIKHIFQHPQPSSLIDKVITIGGWVKSLRQQKTFSFLSINDGSIFSSLQVIVESSCPDFDKLQNITTGASIMVTGKIVQSPGKAQSLEMCAEKITIYGLCDPETYPLQKKRHSFEFLRTIAHLRPRTNTQGALTRVRNALAYATHKFFQERDFLYIQTPIITGSDCEGGGEMFRVTTLTPNEIKKLPDGSYDYSKDFFHKSSYLTVSGQLNAEILTCSLGDVYTFGPTFRAENSNTSRHLAEFWMIEPEIAFADIQDLMTSAEDYIKYLITYVLTHCKEDMEFFNQFIEKGLIERLEKVMHAAFHRITYSEAVDILLQSKQSFIYPVQWGSDLQSEHERYLTEQHFKGPVIVTNYPASIKAFYMRENDDEKTVAAMDVLVPHIGEIIGGSQREERYDVLEQKMKKLQLNIEDYWWYLELRKYGTIPHAGYGLGFERLLQFITGLENIRDVIAFPRYPGHVDF